MKKDSVVKTVFFRASVSGLLSGTLGLLILMLLSLFSGRNEYTPFLPEYRSYFPSDTIATCVYYFLITCIGATFGGCSLIWDMERWSYVKQGVLHFLITTIVWLPISCFIWAPGTYKTAFVNMFIAYFAVYLTTWIANIIKCKHMVREINKELGY